MSEIAHVTDGDFDAQVLEATVPVVVDFWAAWCMPCHLLAPELEELASAHGDAVRVVKLDVDESPATAGRYGVMGLPTVALFREGRPVAASVGAKPRREIEADLGLDPV